MDDPPLASLSLTHVHYNPSDPLSYLCAWLSLSPQVLCISYLVLLWSTREAEILLQFAGQMACELLNWLLKRYIKEERPRQMNGKGYGMPSSHAQFVAFFSVSLTLFLLGRHRPTGEGGRVGDVKGGKGEGRVREEGKRGAVEKWWARTHSTFVERLLLSGVSLVCAGLVAYSRIYLNYHTPKQVLVGVGVGVACAVVWFGITEGLRLSGLLDWALDLQVAQFFRMRDLLVTEDLVQAGWESWQQSRERKKELKKR